MNHIRLELKNGINGCLDDFIKEISRLTLRAYGEGNWVEIKAALQEWESKGFLRVLRDPETSRDDEICVEMLHYIEQKSNWPNWLP